LRDQARLRDQALLHSGFHRSQGHRLVRAADEYGAIV
jgi:hypothetical protein